MRRALVGVVGLLWLLGGCATPAPSGRGGAVGEWRGPAQRTAVASEPWTYRDAPGAVLTSANYRLHTTIANPSTAESLIQVLEAALPEYRRLAPTVGSVGQPMQAYVFANRLQWADFTRRGTGALAAVYLQINRGGYTLQDQFVAFLVSERDTWSVTAHEGFHQFSSRHFKGRLPPFLEEGLSTTFEQVRWEPAQPPGRGVPRLNTRYNPQRAQQLRKALEDRDNWPLAELITLHAGRVVGQRAGKIDAFYAQSWAFARFLQEYDNARHLPGFRRWMADVVSGEVVDPTGTHRLSQGPWDPSAVKPVLEHYLATDLATLQTQFDQWCRHLAFDEFRRQWTGG
jgi:hypothetical protein